MGKQHSRTAGGLQRHHLEIAIICISGVRLCSALAALGIYGSAWSLILVHVSSLLLEFGYSKLASPYCLRKCETHGLAQGVLAVPSVLAALATVAPQGAWLVWMQGSCGAAVSILLTVHLQSLSAAAATEKAIAARGRHAPAVADHTAVSRTDSNQPNTNGSAQQQHHNHLMQSNKPQGQQPQNSSIKQQLKTALPAVLCGLLAAGAGWLASMQHSSPARFAVQQQQHEQHQCQQQQDPGEAIWLLLAATCLGVALAPALYCLIMHLLPSCFSIGEGALMAQGAAGLAVAAAMAVPDAAAFIPTVACQLLPQHALDVVVGLGGCTSEAHSRALSLAASPSAIVLVLASTLLVCLLLRVMLAVLGISCSSASSTGGQPAAEAAVSARRAAAAATGDSRNQGSSGSGSRSRFSHARGLHSWLLAAALCAGMGVALLWLGCAAAWTLLEFLPARTGRLMVLLYWVGLLGVTLPALRLWASHSRMPQIVVRKVYHLLAGGLFVPVFFWDLQLLCLSLAIAFAALVLLEVLRCLQLPGLGLAVQQFMQGFVDERDSGVIYVTHFTLLLGLAVPMWLCLGLPGIQAFVGASVLDSSSMQCGSSSSAGSCMGNDATAAAAAAAGTVNSPGLNLDHFSSNPLLLVMAGLSGMVIIGVGDTAASMVGKLLGRVPIHAGSRKTVEGTVAGITSSLGAWCLLLWCGGLGGGGWQWWLQLLLATAGAGLMEACTSQLDNILLPLWYLPHLVLVQH